MSAAAFANASDLANRLRAEVETGSAEAILAEVSAEVRAATGQTISAVVDDVVVLQLQADRWELVLPQRPAQEPTAVTMNGAGLSYWYWDGLQTVWLSPYPGGVYSDGWSFSTVELGPAMGYRRVRTATVTYSHGSDDADWLALARSITLGAAVRLYDNPTGDKQEAIDDYQRQRADSPASGALTDAEISRLRNFYGRTVGSVAMTL